MAIFYGCFALQTVSAPQIDKEDQIQNVFAERLKEHMDKNGTLAWLAKVELAVIKNYINAEFTCIEIKWILFYYKQIKTILYKTKNENKPGFSKTRSIIEAAFYGNNVVQVNTLKEAYNLAKNSPGTIIKVAQTLWIAYFLIF